MKLYRNLLPAVVLLFAGVTAPLGCGGDKQHRSGERTAEIPMTMADLPPVVRTTLEKESAGGKVMEIEKENKAGQTIYSADVLLQGKTWDIAIAENGKLISKELEGADEKKPEK
jgi:hypothetical protein